MSDLREQIAAIVREARLNQTSQTAYVDYADRIIALIRNPNLDDCPRYAAGDYSRRNLEAFTDDIAAIADTHPKGQDAEERLGS